MGSSVHLSLFWPSYTLARLVIMIERASCSYAVFVLPSYTADIVARSIFGRWKINMKNRKSYKSSTFKWAEYISALHAKHLAPPEIKDQAFGISQAIEKTAPERARPMLEAQETNYG